MIKLKSLLLKLLVSAYFGRQLKQNTFMIKRLGDYMADIRGELKLVSKHASMVTIQGEQVLKA